MTPTLTPWIRRSAAGAALATALIAVIIGCSTGSDSTTSTAIVPASSSMAVAPSVAPGTRVVLRFGDQNIAATLEETAASRELVAELPLALEFRDAWGQAKSGRLPHSVPVDGAARTLKPAVGGIYYWPDTAALAVYYDDLGQSVPPPGLIHLGRIDTGIDEIADAGRQVTILIDRAPTSSS
jgi:hypothetical protein